MTDPRGLRAARRAMEGEVAEFVIDALRAEGRQITDITRPDETERNARAPDFAFTCDDERIALEVTEFTADRKERHARAVAQDLAKLLQGRFQSEVQDRQLGLVHLTFMYWDERVPTRRLMTVDAPRVIAKFAAALADVTPGERVSQSVDLDVDWLGDGRVMILPEHRSRVWVGPGPAARWVEAAITDFVDRAIATKAGQATGYDRTILAVINGWVGDAEDYQSVLRLHADVPWWRIYIVGQGLNLVYETA